MSNFVIWVFASWVKWVREETSFNFLGEWIREHGILNYFQQNISFIVKFWNIFPSSFLP